MADSRRLAPQRRQPVFWIVCGVAILLRLNLSVLQVIYLLMNHLLTEPEFVFECVRFHAQAWLYAIHETVDQSPRYSWLVWKRQLPQSSAIDHDPPCVD